MSCSIWLWRRAPLVDRVVPCAARVLSRRLERARRLGSIETVDVFLIMPGLLNTPASTRHALDRVHVTLCAHSRPRTLAQKGLRVTRAAPKHDPRREPLDLSAVTPIAIGERKNLVTRGDFGTLVDPHGSIADLIASFPAILAGDELRAAIEAVARARRAGRPVWAAMGGHVVKVAQGPALIDLLDRGIVTGFAMNGATAIHDLELALIGETSENVEVNIADGSFGMAAETADLFRVAASRSADGIGLGQALGEAIEERQLPHRSLSMLAAAARAGAPCTVHVGFGTDVVHMHPGVLDAALGEASALDFRILCAHATDLGEIGRASRRERV